MNRPPETYLHTPKLFNDPKDAATYFMDGRSNTVIVHRDEQMDPLVAEMLTMTDPTKINDPETQQFFHDRPLLAHPHMADRLVCGLSPILS